jgi:hypothetical protein
MRNNINALPQTNNTKIEIGGKFHRELDGTVEPLYDYPILSRGRICLLSGPLSAPKYSTKAELLQTEQQKLSWILYPSDFVEIRHFYCVS